MKTSTPQPAHRLTTRRSTAPQSTAHVTCEACLQAMICRCTPPSGVSIRTPSSAAAKASKRHGKPCKKPPKSMPSQLDARRHSSPPTAAGAPSCVRTRLRTHRVVALISLLLLAACVPTRPATDFTTESGGSPAQSDVARPGDARGLAAVVTRVVDGDTIIVQVQDQTETIRLLGIDTPEKAGGPRPAECFGAEASARLAELLPPQTQVLLSRDLESRDQYSRLLAFVHRTDGVFVNLIMVEEGYATPLFFAPNRSAEEQFTAAGNAARRRWVGFWPACGAPDVVLQAS